MLLAPGPPGRRTLKALVAPADCPAVRFVAIVLLRVTVGAGATCCCVPAVRLLALGGTFNVVFARSRLTRGLSISPTGSLGGGTVALRDRAGLGSEVGRSSGAPDGVWPR